MSHVVPTPAPESGWICQLTCFAPHLFWFLLLRKTMPQNTQGQSPQTRTSVPWWDDEDGDEVASPWVVSPRCKDSKSDSVIPQVDLCTESDASIHVLITTCKPHAAPIVQSKSHAQDRAQALAFQNGMKFEFGILPTPGYHVLPLLFVYHDVTRWKFKLIQVLGAILIFV